METTILVLVAGTAVAGVAGQWLGWRLRMPAIIPLLVIGALLGPVTGFVKPSTALGEVMRPAIGMAVAIIVFEGGLNLNLRELRSAGSGVWRLVGLALPLNFALGTLACRYVAGLPWPVAILVGTILVVTGPTVIMPLLRQAKLEPRAAAFLKWEAIVNDPIGATLTLLVLSYLVESRSLGGGAAALQIAGKAVLGVVIAAALGVVAPFAIRGLFRRDLAPEYLKVPILLAGALGVYAAGEAIQPETGLVGATLFGVVLSNIDVTGLQELRRFKESLTVFLVSGLFILLTANIDPHVLRQLSWPIALTTLAILFVVRPLATTLATLGAKMSWRERLLVGWIGPRGVVAAAIAGVAGEQLARAGYPGAERILPLVFSVIAATVILHGFSLAPLAQRLGLASKAPPGLLIVGATPWTIGLAETLRRLGVPTLLADRTWNALHAARLAGLSTLRVEPLSAVGEGLLDLRELDYLLAATEDDAYNALVCTRFAPEFGRERVHQTAPREAVAEAHATSREWRGKIAVHPELHPARLAELIAGGHVFHATRVEEAGRLPDMPGREGWPVLLVYANGQLAFFSPEHELSVSPGDTVVSFVEGRQTAAERRRFSFRWPRRARAAAQAGPLGA